MFPIEKVLGAVQIALAKRGFSYPRAGERSKDAVVARLLAFDAIYTLTGGSITGIASVIGSSSASGRSFKDRSERAYRNKQDRLDWIEEVRSMVAVQK